MKIVTRCQSCDGDELRHVLSLGYMPPVNMMVPVGAVQGPQTWLPTDELLDGMREELPKATATNVLKRTLIQAGIPMADEATALALPHALTGTLSSSIYTGDRLSKTQRELHGKEMKVEVYVGPRPLVQAITEEFGTSHNAPHPFLRPAWDAGKKPALDKIKELMTIEIEKARQRIARKAERLAAKSKK